MKEDILEQLIEDYYVAMSGWFVKHNIKLDLLKIIQIMFQKKIVFIQI
jgi:hypothetical protein